MSNSFNPPKHFSRMQSQYQTAIISTRNDKFLQQCWRQEKQGGNHRDLAALLSATEKTAGVLGLLLSMITQNARTACKPSGTSAEYNSPFCRQKKQHSTIYQPAFFFF